MPNTWRSFRAFVLAFSCMFGRRNNPALHYASYTSTLGCIMCMFVPFFLNKQLFWDLRSISGMVHHSWAFLMILFMLLEGRFVPAKQNSLAFLIGSAVMMGLGFLEKYALGYDSAMQIGEPFVAGNALLAILTS